MLIETQLAIETELVEGKREALYRIVAGLISEAQKQSFNFADFLDAVADYSSAQEAMAEEITGLIEQAAEKCRS